MTRTIDPAEIRSALCANFGFSEFRPLQEEIISGVLNGHDVFVLMPTGGGKSLCYQLPALLLPGITLVVSPLIALMKDQVDALTANGIPATYLNSSLSYPELEERRQGLLSGRFKLLYLAPERLLTEGFMGFLERLPLSLFAIDEAHCISEWGHDFRQDYRQLAKLRDRFSEVPIIAMTATANGRVQEDIVEQLHLHEDVLRFRASFDRDNLFYAVRGKRRGIDQVLEVVDAHRGESGIIYCQSRARCESIAAFLQEQGVRALPYHAGLGPDERAGNQEQFVRDDVDVVCATIAFGMGIDKPDVRYVVHYDLPKNLMGYYQETGRAGRDGLPSDCVLFYSPGDRVKIQRFIDEKIDPRERAIAMGQLDEMTAYADTLECRRKVILSYFGEEYGRENCGNCDNCTATEEAETYDATRHAQMFLSCAIRLNEGFGAAYVIDVLRGSENARLLNYRHNLLPTYGIGAELSKNEWRTISHALLGAGMIYQDPNRYNVVMVTDVGWELIRGERQLTLRKPREEKPAPAARGKVVLPPTGRELFERLRRLRKKVADRQSIPAYMIFDDRTLTEMAGQLPRGRADLLRLHGIGQVKADRYGDIFLEEVEAFLEEHPELQGARPKTRGYRPPPPPASAEQTLQMFQEGMSLGEIVRALKLKRGTIIGHLESLLAEGKIDDVARLLPPERVAAIESAFERVGFEKLKAVLRELEPEQYSYDELRLVRAWIQGRDS